MNREIKFRAFDGVDYVTKPFTLLDIQNGKIQFASSDTKIMQFTGLLDKDGKEIYEGDICKAKYAGSSEREYKNKIEWNESECSFSFANAPLWAWEKIEVIGNIYQNPELIKQHL